MFPSMRSKRKGAEDAGGAGESGGGGGGIDEDRDVNLGGSGELPTSKGTLRSKLFLPSSFLLTKRTTRSSGMNSGPESELSADNLQRAISEMRDGVLMLPGERGKLELSTLQGLETMVDAFNLVKRVKAIHVEDNYLKSLEPLSSLARLQKIYASNNQLTLICEPENRFSRGFDSLILLDLTANRLVEVPDISQMPKLRTLLLAENQISSEKLVSGFSQYSNLPLEVLDINGNPLEWNDLGDFFRGVSFFEKLGKLKRLGMDVDIKDFHLYVLYYLKRARISTPPIAQIGRVVITKAEHDMARKLDVSMLSIDATGNSGAGHGTATNPEELTNNNKKEPGMSDIPPPFLTSFNQQPQQRKQRSSLGFLSFRNKRNSVQNNLGHRDSALAEETADDLSPNLARMAELLVPNTVEESVADYVLNMARTFAGMYEKDPTSIASFFRGILDDQTERSNAIDEFLGEIVLKIDLDSNNFITGTLLSTVAYLASIPQYDLSKKCFAMLATYYCKPRVGVDEFYFIMKPIIPIYISSQNDEILSNLSSLIRLTKRYDVLSSVAEQLMAYLLARKRRGNVELTFVSSADLFLRILELVFLTSMDQDGAAILCAHGLPLFAHSAYVKLPGKRYDHGAYCLLIGIFENLSKFSTLRLNELTIANKYDVPTNNNNNNNNNNNTIRKKTANEDTSSSTVGKTQQSTTRNGQSLLVNVDTSPTTAASIASIAINAGNDISVLEYFLKLGLDKDLARDLGVFVELGSSEISFHSREVSSVLNCFNSMLQSSRIGFQAILGKPKNKFFSRLLALYQMPTIHPLILTSVFKAIYAIADPKRIIHGYFPVVILDDILQDNNKSTKFPSRVGYQSITSSTKPKKLTWKKTFSLIAEGLNGVVPLLEFLGDEGNKHVETMEILEGTETSMDAREREIIMYDLQVACVDVIRLFCAEANKSSTGTRNHLAEKIARDLDNAGRESYLFAILRLPYYSLRLAVLRCLENVPLNQIDTDEIASLVTMLKDQTDAGVDQNEELIKGALALLSDLCIADVTYTSASKFRDMHGETVIQTALKILKNNITKQSSSSSSAASSVFNKKTPDSITDAKISLSMHCIHFLMAAGAFPALRVHFESNSTIQEFKNILQLEEAADPTFSATSMMNETRPAPSLLEWIYTSRKVSVLLDILPSCDSKGKMTSRLLRRCADVLIGYPYANLEDKFTRRTESEVSKDHIEDSSDDDDDDDDGNAENNDGNESSLNEKKANDDDAAAADDDDDNVFNSRKDKLNSSPRATVISSMSGLDKKTSLYSILKRNGDSDDDDDSAVGAGKLSEADMKLFNFQNLVPWLQDVCIVLSLPLCALDKLRDFQALNDRAIGFDRGLLPFWSLDDWTLLKDIKSSPDQAIVHESFLQSQGLRSIMNHLGADDSLVLRAEVFNANDQASLQTLLHWSVNSSDEITMNYNRLIGGENIRSRGLTPAINEEVDLGVSIRRELMIPRKRGVQSSTGPNLSLLSTSSNITSNHPSQESWEEDSSIPLRALSSNVVSGDVDFAELSPDASLRSLDIPGSDSIAAYLRILFALLRCGSANTKNATQAFLCDPANLAKLAALCLGPKRKPVYHRCMIGAKFFEICRIICPSAESIQSPDPKIQAAQLQKTLTIYSIISKAIVRVLGILRQRLFIHRRAGRVDSGLAFHVSRCLYALVSNFDRIPTPEEFALSEKSPIIRHEMFVSALWIQFVPIQTVGAVLSLLMFDMERHRNERLWVNEKDDISEFQTEGAMFDGIRHALQAVLVKCLRHAECYRYQILEECTRSDIIDRFPIRPSFIHEMLAFVAKESFEEKFIRYSITSNTWLMPSFTAGKLNSKAYQEQESVFGSSLFTWCAGPRPGKAQENDKSNEEKKDAENSLTNNEAANSKDLSNAEKESLFSKEDETKILAFDWTEVVSSVHGVIGQRLVVMSSKSLTLYRYRYAPKPILPFDTNPRNFGAAFDMLIEFDKDVERSGFVKESSKDFSKCYIDRVCVGPYGTQHVSLRIVDLPSESGLDKEILLQQNSLQESDGSGEWLTLLLRDFNSPKRFINAVWNLFNHPSSFQFAHSFILDQDTKIWSQVAMNNNVSSIVNVEQFSSSMIVLDVVFVAISRNVGAKYKPNRRHLIVTDHELIILAVNWQSWAFAFMNNGRISIQGEEGEEFPAFLTEEYRIKLDDISKISFEGFDIPSVTFSVVLQDFELYFQNDTAREVFRRSILVTLTKMSIRSIGGTS